MVHDSLHAQEVESRIPIVVSILSLPAELFNGGSQDIVVGSVVWLYCVVNYTEPTLTTTWTRDSAPLIQDIPHVRMPRSTSDGNSTTFILIVDIFRSSDSGVYQCVVEYSGITGMGTALTLTGTSTLLHLLSMYICLLHYIASTLNFASLQFRSNSGNRNRATGTYLQIDMGHVGDAFVMYTTPTVTWLRDGVPVNAVPTNTPGSNGRLTTALSSLSDAGVYQGIFVDTIRSEVFAASPIRLDTGEGLPI